MQRIAHAAGKETRIQNGARRHGQAHPGGMLEKQGANQGKRRDKEELTAGQLHAVHHGDKVIHQKDLCCKHKGAQHHAEVAGGDGKALRDAQAHALHLPNTGMACAIDLGEAYDIHPKNKQEVGKRLAQAALTKTYNKGTYEVPAFLGYRISGRTLILTFDQEVVAKEGAPKGFILAGPDGKYVPAQATIRGKEVILQSDRIEIPTAACYAWADNPVCNLYGKSGLPVPPFRTRE